MHDNMMIADVGRHGEGQRQQDGDAIGAAQSGQHADDDAEQDADQHQQHVERRQNNRKAVEQRTDLKQGEPSSEWWRILNGATGSC
jgi:hypothetical protein